MLCPNCGKEIPAGAKFCTKCGKPVAAGTPIADSNVNDSFPDASNNGQEPAKEPFVWGEKHTYVAIAGAVIIAAGIGLAVRFSHNNSVDTFEQPMEDVQIQDESEIRVGEVDDEGGMDADDADVTEDEPQDIAEEELQIEEYDENSSDDGAGALLDEYGIDADTVEDYSENLDPNQYLYCDTGIGELYFYYPANLFCDVSVDDSSFSTEYGDNLKTICFSGSNGSELYYAAYERTDGMSISDMTEWLNQSEHTAYYDMSDILVKSDDEKGRIVLAGIMDSDGKYRVYDLIKIDENFVYRMLSVKPMYKSDEERIMYAYVTENEYRMCGFSGSSSAPRSYQEYVEGNP